MSGADGSEPTRYGADPSQFVEMRHPQSEPKGLAVLIHGGYWRDRYALDLMEPMARHVVAQGWVAANIEYRRVPERVPAEIDGGPPWVAMSQDQRSALAAARAHYRARWRTDPGVITVIGHSAGGQLALWLGKAAADDQAVDLVVALAPVADLVDGDARGLSDGAVSLLLGGGSEQLPDRYREASPRHLLPLGVAQLVVHGDADVNVPPDMTDAYAAAGLAAGDRVELLTPTGVDHFDVIDPAHAVWRAIDARMEALATP